MVGLILSNYLYSEDKKILDIDKGFIRNIWNCEIRRRMLENRINIERKKMEKLPQQIDRMNKKWEYERSKIEREISSLWMIYYRCRDDRCRERVERDINIKENEIKNIDRQVKNSYDGIMRSVEASINFLMNSLSRIESGIDCGDNIKKEYNNNKESLNLSKKTVDLNEYERLKGVIDNMVLADYEDENEFNKAVKGLLNSSEYVVEGGSKENKELDCSGFIGKVYDELDNEKVKSITVCDSTPAVKDCAKLSQKQYEYLADKGKIVNDITKLKPMSALYFEEGGKVVHAMLFEYYGKKGEPVESSKCTLDYCPIVVVSTSKGKPVEEKSIPLKNGCYLYCPTKRIKGKCPVSEKEQCFVGGGIP